MVRGTDPHIFAVRALLAAGITDKDVTPVLVQQHADGGTALLRGDVDAWAGLDPMMAQHEIKDGARLFYRKPEANTWGILNVREEFAKDHPDVVRPGISAYEEASKYSLANYDELKKIFIGVTGLDGAVVDKQLKERTELTHNKVGPAQRESILEAGLALQKAGVIGASTDVKKSVDELIDDRYVTAANRRLRPARRISVNSREFRDIALEGCAVSLVSMTAGVEQAELAQTAPKTGSARVLRPALGLLLPVALAVFWE